MLVSNFSQYKPLPAQTQRASWPAFLDLTFTGSDRGTALRDCTHQGPLYVQKAFYPEGKDCAHVYLLHPPGGIVSGDTLEVRLNLEDSANVLLTTPGASRLYRARIDESQTEPLLQRITNTLEVGTSSQLEWLPNETIVYDGAIIDLVTEVQLAPNATFCGWEITCLGLPAADAPFKHGRFSQRFSIYRDKQPCILDRIAFDAHSKYLQSLCGFQSQPVFGSFIAGPLKDSQQGEKSLIDEMLEALRTLIASSKLEAYCAVTCVNGFIVLRYLGPCSEQARHQFVNAWQIIRPHLNGRMAVNPRIWAT